MLKTTISLTSVLLLTLSFVSYQAHARDYGCLENSTTSCLQDGRFQLSAFAIRPNGKRVQAKIKEALIGDDASLFYFFEFDNVELLVKVLNGCWSNGKYWVFGSAGTDLKYTVTVKDLPKGREKTYRRHRYNPLINDTNAFNCR